VSIKIAQRGQLIKHIDSAHEKTKTFEGSKVAKKINFTVHEKIKLYECSLCPYNFCRKDHLTRHIADVHEQEKTGFKKFD
jgi:uncharacterized Zn-finger protein